MFKIFRKTITENQETKELWGTYLIRSIIIWENICNLFFFFIFLHFTVRVSQNSCIWLQYSLFFRLYPMAAGLKEAAALFLHSLLNSRSIWCRCFHVVLQFSLPLLLALDLWCMFELIVTEKKKHIRLLAHSRQSMIRSKDAARHKAHKAKVNSCWMLWLLNIYLFVGYLYLLNLKRRKIFEWYLFSSVFSQAWVLKIRIPKQSRKTRSSKCDGIEQTDRCALNYLMLASS